MHSTPLSDKSILRDGNSRQLEKAAAYNHLRLFCLEAISNNGVIKTIHGLTWTYAGPNKKAMIPFPSLEEKNAGEQLDEMMAWFREHPPISAGCWSLDPPQPADLNIKLLARGFQPGWHPCWMVLDLETINADHPIPEGLHISADNDTAIHDVENLPYGDDNGPVSPQFMKLYPERAQRFIATLNEKIVGHSFVLLSTGECGAAGIYSVGVVPDARNQGIGKALVLASCFYAKEQGYRYAILNATGRRMYEQIGFRWISDGHTWWLMSRRYVTNPPSQNLVALAEAVGKGDLTAMDNLSKQFRTDDLNTPITNGMMLMELAVHCRQPNSAEWLIGHGAEFTVLDAWDLGWKDRTEAMVKSHPLEINRQYGNMKTTIMHTAAERNDIALAQLALSASPDLELKDKTYNGTALGWAEYFQREEIVRLIKEYMG